MYVEQAHRLSSEQVERLRGLVSRLDLNPGPGGSRITPAPVLSGDTELLGMVGGLFVASVVALYPSSQIVAHRDPPIRGRRYHIPLTVNDGCWVFHGGAWQQLREGHCYGMDPIETHGAVNWGSTVRLHLMIDVDGYGDALWRSGE